ncbi:MAG: glucosamine-6-phosphate deaminase, partial [Synergistaceae bacterium]|nr:glucosamine-6-phosphate deaminase [Synergistaceae bacterium]
STPIGIYKQLAEWYVAGDLDFSKTVSVNLDEYVGLAPDNPQSYRYYMDNNFFRHVNIKPENTHLPNGLAADRTEECSRYEAVIRSCGGINIQLLGIGHNGHIGFNEPGTAFEVNTHCVSLSESTIRANSRFFDRESEVPRFAYTMGIRTIMQARCIVIIASGADKAQILKNSFSGPVTPQVPASVLQLHNDVILVGDGEALSLFPQDR